MSLKDIPVNIGVARVAQRRHHRVQQFRARNQAVALYVQMGSKWLRLRGSWIFRSTRHTKVRMRTEMGDSNPRVLIVLLL